MRATQGPPKLIVRLTLTAAVAVAALVATGKLLFASVDARLPSGASPIAQSDPRVVIDDMVVYPGQLHALDGPRAATGFTVDIRPWPRGIVPVAFDPSVTPPQRDLFLQMCRRWAARAPGVGCVVRTVEAVALNVLSSPGFNGGQATLGYSPVFRRELTIGASVWGNSLVLHELGHVFGLIHEHQRPDRDTYVAIDLSNVIPEARWIYDILDVGLSQTYGPYDFLSVMHYSPFAWAITLSRPNIIAKPPYESFQYRMGTANDLSEADLESMADIYTRVPAAPVDVTAEVGNGAVTLTWRPAPSGGRATHFEILAGTSPTGGELGQFDVGSVTSVSASLAPARYYVAVRARNEVGQSPYTAVDFTIPTVEVPGTPRALSASVVGQVVTLSWQPPLGQVPDRYVLSAGATPGAADVLSASVGPSTSLRAQAPPGRYFVRVQAENQAGRGAPSNEVVVDVGPACVAPTPPVVRATRVAREVTISWSSQPSAQLREYVLSVGSAIGSSDVYLGTVGLATSASGVVNPGAYYVKLTAISLCGSSSQSETVVIAVP